MDRGFAQREPQWEPSGISVGFHPIVLVLFDRVILRMGRLLYGLTLRWRLRAKSVRIHGRAILRSARLKVLNSVRVIDGALTTEGGRMGGCRRLRVVYSVTCQFWSSVSAVLVRTRCAAWRIAELAEVRTLRAARRA